MNRLDTKRRAAIVRALVEGVGIRATCRMTDCSKGTVTKLIAELGPACEAYQDWALAGLSCSTLEVDECWSFVAKKQKRVKDHERGMAIGDAWTFTAICADSKLIPTWLVGPRDASTAAHFLGDLASRMRGRVQVTTDGHPMYLDAMDEAFGGNADYAMLVKVYGQPQEPQRRYSPAECIGTRRAKIQGTPDPSRISTSYVERSNLSLRMGLRRFTRLTNGHSKKWENHCAALAIFFMHYNFARVHQATRVSPAMAAGVTGHLWSVEEIVGLLERAERGEEIGGETRHTPKSSGYRER